MEVLQFTGLTTNDLDPDTMLGNIIGAGLTEIVVCALDKDGELVICGSRGDANAAIVLIEMCKQQMLDMVRGHIMAHNP